MHILFIVPYVPTPIRVRPYNLIKSLAARDHRLTLATLWTTEEERDRLGELEALGVRIIAAPLPRWRSLLNCLRALPTPIPLQAVYCCSRPLRARIEAELPHHALRNTQYYDIVHVEHLRGAYYSLGLEGVPVVWDSVDCISFLFEQAARDSQSLSGRLMTRFDLERTRSYEGWLVGQFDRVLVTSQADKLALEDLATQGAGYRIPGTVSRPLPPVTVLPNGVDLDYFTPTEVAREPYTLIYLGKMSYHANVTAALHLVRHIMPFVWGERPQVKLYIVGANPPRQIRKLAEEFPAWVEVTGTVPDVRPYLRRASVAVAPVLYGAGIQNKVLEALACGTPVVATTQACAALEVTQGEDLLVAQEPREFAQGVLRLLEDQELAARLGTAGRRYVEKNHNWGVVTEKLEEVYREVVGPRADMVSVNGGDGWHLRPTGQADWEQS
jgi:glycosyltransferase involved in cell wall biosynthesis